MRAFRHKLNRHDSLRDVSMVVGRSSSRAPTLPPVPENYGAVLHAPVAASRRSALAKVASALVGVTLRCSTFFVTSKGAGRIALTSDGGTPAFWNAW